MEYIKNFYPGACAAITFYQFAMSSDKLRLPMFREYFVELGKTLPENKRGILEVFIEKFKKAEPTLAKYWINARSHKIEFKDFPHGADIRLLKEPIDGLGYQGRSEYGVMVFFCRYVFAMETGKDMEWARGATLDEARDILHAIDLDTNRYTEYMRSILDETIRTREDGSTYRYKCIPYVSYFFDMDENGVLDTVGHVFLTYKVGPSLYEIYDSNVGRLTVYDKLVFVWIGDAKNKTFFPLETFDVP